MRRISRWVLNPAGDERARDFITSGLRGLAMSHTSGLTVRQHEREGIHVPVEFHVSHEHSTQLHFSSASSAAGQHAVLARAVDISTGGMGLECRHFVPRGCEGVVRVMLPDPHSVSSDGSPLMLSAFEHHAKVRRVYMVGREPMYALGLAFIDPQSDIDHRVADLLRRIRSEADSVAMRTAPGGSHA